jgi:hypothetical protein
LGLPAQELAKLLPGGGRTLKNEPILGLSHSSSVGNDHIERTAALQNSTVFSEAFCRNPFTSMTLRLTAPFSIVKLT